MTSRDFCFWLQGMFELAKPAALSSEQTDLVRRHLSMVFLHEIDPSIPDPSGKLQAAHDGKPAPVIANVPSLADMGQMLKPVNAQQWSPSHLTPRC